MRATQVNNAQNGPVLVPAEIPTPQPKEDELVIRVSAVGVTPTELLWYPTTHTKEGAVRSSAVPGHEFSGVVTAIGKEIRDFKIGDEIYGMNDWFADGATAEFCITKSKDIAIKPASLTHEIAATVPIGALTAWQGLIDRAKIQPGERVLIHGGAGSVGLFAIQLAHLYGAHAITTVSEHNLDFVKQLGADEAVDYRRGHFEDHVGKVDVVFDTVGGETRERSWGVIRSGGRMVTIAADGESASDQRTKDAFLLVEARHEQLVEIARKLDAGELKSFVNAVVAFEDAALAYSGAVEGKRGYGKIVIKVGA